MRPDARIVTFDDGVEALLPLTFRESRKGLVHGWLSSPAGTYGGWIADERLTAGHGAELVQYLQQRHPDLTLRVNPFDPVQSQLFAPDAAEVTWVIDLSQSAGAIEAGMHGKQIQRKVRKADGYGLLLERLDIAQLDALYAVYRDCLLRWKAVRQVHDIGLFQALIESADVDFWGVRTPSDDVVAVALVLKAARHVVPWAAYATSLSLRQQPYEFMFHALIHHYRDRGYRWFDFNPSGGQAGVERFKRSFGAQRMDCPLIVRTSAWAQVVGHIAGMLRG